jgi:hypothetical protein
VILIKQVTQELIYTFYVPLPYITYLIHAQFPNLPHFPRKWDTYSAYAVHYLISPLLYVPHNGPALPKKSAKIEICQQSKLSVSSSSADTHTVKVYCEDGDLKLWAAGRNGDIKLPLFR